MLMIFVIVGCLVLALRWNSDGHIMMTRMGFQKALGLLETNGKLKQLYMSRKGMSRMFNMLGLYDATEDTEWCNVNDKFGLQNVVPSMARSLQGHGFDSCALAVGGDQ